jgi:hypothetical protein
MQEYGGNTHEGCNYHRSNLFVMSFQIEGICSAIRTTVSMGDRPGPATLTLLRSLRDSFVSVGSGFTVEHIPTVHDDMNPHDALAVAEVLRTTILAFLSPDEAEERGTFGFHANISTS